MSTNSFQKVEPHTSPLDSGMELVNEQNMANVILRYYLPRLGYKRNSFFWPSLELLPLREVPSPVTQMLSNLWRGHREEPLASHVGKPLWPQACLQPTATRRIKV